MIIEHVPMWTRIENLQNKLRELRVGDWSADMGDARYLAERQVLAGVLATIVKEHEMWEKGGLDLRELERVADPLLKVLEDRLK